MVEEVREMSLRDVGIRGLSSYERAIGQRRQGTEQAVSARETLRTDTSSDNARRLARDRSIRVWQERNARANSDRRVEHQSSLRSLLSASDDGSSDMKDEILRQIIDEGLLDDVNLDELSAAQEDELSEKIADAYRRRHMQNSRNQRSRSRDTRVPSSPPADQQDQNEGQQRNRRARQTTTSSNHEPHSSHPPVSRPHLLEAYPVSQQHRRRASSEHRRQTSPVPNSSSNRASVDVSRQAARSSTDLSTESRHRPQRLENSRRTTDPDRQQASERQHNGARQALGTSGATLETRSQESASRSPRSSTTNVAREQAPATSSPRSAQFSSATQTRSEVIQASRPANQPNASLRIIDRPRGASSTSNATPYSLGSPPEAIAHLQDTSRSSDQPLPLFSEPSISCQRCSKPSIQYDLHHHCSRCPYDICHRCYLLGKGCLHWFGFGKTALARWKRKGEPGAIAPHVLIARKYIRPRSETSRDFTAAARSDHPSQRLRTGFFCASCLDVVNALFLACERCNDAEWGFCLRCVDDARCCTHSLYPIAFDTTASLDSSPPPVIAAGTNHDQNSPSVNPLPHKPTIPPTKTCAFCTQPITLSASEPRAWHCPSCTSQTQSDLHIRCHEALTSMRRIPNNIYRPCINGHHPMQLITLTSTDPLSITFNQNLGPSDHNVLYSEKKKIEKKGNASSSQQQPPPSLPPSSNQRQPPSSQQQQQQQIGKTIGPGQPMTAAWAYWPAEGVEDELGFPRGAEVWQAQDINGDWAWGWYAGRSGLYPGGYVRG